MIDFKPPASKKPLMSASSSSPHLDESSGLYSFLHYMQDLQEVLVKQRALGLIYIDASDLCKIEYDYGHSVYSEVLREAIASIQELKGKLIRQDDILSIRHPRDENFLLFLSAKREEYTSFLKMENLQQIIERFSEQLNARIFELTYPYTKKILKADIGYSYAVFNPLLSQERTVYRLIEQGKSLAKFNGDRFMIKVHESLKEIIIEENIRTLYQPIVDLKTGKIFAYEALSRGPKGTAMESPLMLFGVADKTNLSFELDRLCRRKALQNIRNLCPDQKLFINTFPNTMHDPEFRGEELNHLLSSSKLAGSNIVFEVTERVAIENYALFQKEHQYFSARGFGLAVDDIGSGYGSLEAIANLRPEFVKVDLCIIRNIHEHSVKQELLKAITDIARKINAKILVEGIEKREELEVVRSFDIDFGQGFYLGRPEADLLPPDTIIDLDH
ncbi:MAG: EAL domain-containing protein [Bdellovibrionota bacterium]